MRTLERKKSNAGRLTSANGNSSSRLHHAGPGGPSGLKNGNGSGEQNEFDDLISALRTGDVFGENMDKFRRNRKTRGSPPRVDRMDSFLRERSHHEVIYQTRQKWRSQLVSFLFNFIARRIWVFPPNNFCERF